MVDRWLRRFPRAYVRIDRAQEPGRDLLARYVVELGVVRGRRVDSLLGAGMTLLDALANAKRKEPEGWPPE